MTTLHPDGPAHTGWTLRIRFVLGNAYGGGGTIRTTLTMAGALAERGHDVEIASVLGRPSPPVFEIPPGVRLVTLTGGPQRAARSRWDPRRVAQALLRRFRSRLIHPGDVRYANFSFESDLALWRYLRRQRNVVLVGTRAGINLALARYAPRSNVVIAQEHMNLRRHGEPLRAGFRAHYPTLHALVTLTEGDAEDYRAFLGEQAAVQAIPNAVPDLGAVAPAHERSEDSKIVVAAGRLTRQKGFDLLIGAWRPVVAAHPDWQLHIYGGGHLEADLRRQIDDLGLAESVRLMGFSDDLPRHLSQASLYVLSSRFEGFPLVLLEAMGCGLPVVAFDCPTGPADLIEDGVTGLLVPPKSKRRLSEAMLRAIEDPQLRRTMGRNARHLVESYSQAGIAERWERLFSDLSRKAG
ncbi:glycosyltransferase family 4 protein [Spongisporangium articulatum]|uniref:Glycosyltransferase family 4 protein n=1 Tax=Spongisporangium articulatum TaxID=3362603 RepID=A0ABW8AU77_9ACTN